MNNTITFPDTKLGNVIMNGSAMLLVTGNKATPTETFRAYCDFQSSGTRQDRTVSRLVDAAAAFTPATDALSLAKLTGEGDFAGLNVYINADGEGYSRIIANGTGSKVYMKKIYGLPAFVEVTEDPAAVVTAIEAAATTAIDAIVTP